LLEFDAHDRFGVGELSALNGQAGAFSEHVPLLHIAGVPNTVQLKNKPVLHHTLGDGRYDAYVKAAQQFSVADAQLMEKSNACAQIDRVLTSVITQVCIIMFVRKLNSRLIAL
jgi:pyruvate decarboxylase